MKSNTDSDNILPWRIENLQNNSSKQETALNARCYLVHEKKNTVVPTELIDNAVIGMNLLDSIAILLNEVYTK